MAEKAKKIFDVTLFRRLLDYIKPYKGIFTLSLVCVVGLALFGALRPYVLREAIDSQIALKKLDGFIVYIIIMLIATFGLGGIGFLDDYLKIKHKNKTNFCCEHFQ